MILRLSKKISSFLVNNGIVTKEDQEIYDYSFEVLLATIMNFLALYLIALVLDRVWETTMFIAAFIPLRSLAGGYHAKTHLRCLLVLLIIYALVLIVVIFAPQSFFIFINIGSVFFSVFLVWFLSPVEDENKPLTENEKKHFKFRSRIAVWVYAIIISAGTFLLPDRMEFLCLSLGILSVSLSLLAARIRNRIVQVNDGISH